ncbi:MAG: sulfite exporter TauE/SafE family protein, partial [Phycisphaerales bacterium]|nr:sulfite exporter TauE/SafE family protein [Phycisphaerales bacterium]
FVRAGHFSWSTFWPFGLCAIPLAFVGGLWRLPADVFRPLIGAVLLFAAVSLLWRTWRAAGQDGERGGSEEGRMPRLPVALGAGAGLGLLAGLTGTGGGIFLSPLLILCGWAAPRRAAAVSVVFVLLNSIAGLGGVVAESPVLPRALPVYVMAAVAGGLTGSALGAGRLPARWISGVLGALLVVAAVRMVLQG